ncbi:MAG TPA: preprotein translocase subunit SecG [Oligoflexia bacterium]|nr:preprotein translocase subunit SecG [Oligoflexia bacterium]HMR24996.1 preprotein translocase subunit SecG [Oligoflexia bacterium]
MMGLVSFVHIAVCLLLIIIVLLQHGKGADAGAALGGGQSAVFGARGAASFLSKLTTSCAVIFMVTSLSLVYFSSQQANQTVFDGTESSATPSEVLEKTAESTAAGVSEDAKEVAEDVKAAAKEAIEAGSAASDEIVEQGKVVVDKATQAGKETAQEVKEAVTKTVNEAAKKVEEATDTEKNN